MYIISDNLKETNISKNIELRTEVYWYSRKQNAIEYLSTYTASLLNSQSKLSTKKHHISHLTLNENVYLHIPSNEFNSKFTSV